VPYSASDVGGPLSAVAVGPEGDLFIGSAGYIRKISRDGTVSIVAGGGALYDADGVPATQAKLYYVCNLAVDRAGHLFIADCNDGAHEVTPDGIIHRIALPGRGSPRGVAVDRAGNAFFTKSDSDWVNAEQVFKVSPDGNVTVIAGTGAMGYSGDGGPALSAEFAGPAGVAVDGDGNVYVEDIYNGAVRVLRPAQEK